MHIPIDMISLGLIVFVILLNAMELIASCKNNETPAPSSTIYKPYIILEHLFKFSEAFIFSFVK